MLINEILDLSRVEAGRYELKEESVSLSGVVEDCRHLLAMRAKNRGISVIETLDGDLPRIWADERAVRQVTLNLLTNAIKFTPQGGSIVIKVGWTKSGGQYLSIRDTGPGIPPEEIPIVLSSFGRGSLAQKNAEEGSGLGLPIVKGLVELHGGEFRLQSKLREGTEVIVIFPPERVMEALAAARPLGAQRDRRGARPQPRAPAAGQSLQRGLTCAGVQGVTPSVRLRPRRACRRSRQPRSPDASCSESWRPVPRPAGARPRRPPRRPHRPRPSPTSRSR